MVQDWATWAFSPAISAILITLLISLLSPLLIHLYLYSKASSKTLPSFLLLGPSGSGKTSLLTLFAHGAPSATHTSQEPTSAVCTLATGAKSKEDRYRSEHDEASKSRRKFLMLDTPGHGKLRHHALSSLTAPASVRGLIYVLDSAALSSAAGLTETAEWLHDVLLLLQKRHTQATTSKGPSSVPVLVAANKQDLFTSLPTGLVKAKLEEEIGKVRQTRSKGLLDSGIGMEEDVGGEDEEGNWLGEYGSKEFKFAQMQEAGIEVTIVGGNVKGEGTEKGRVDGWWEWIGENL